MVGNISVIRFEDLRQGMKVRIVRALPDCPECERLMEMGLTEGAEVLVVKVAPLGDPIEVSVRGYRLCLRKRETHCFELEALP